MSEKNKDSAPAAAEGDVTLPFFEERFEQLLSQTKADGSKKWTQDDINSVIPFLTIATVEKWDLENADDDQIIALAVTQEALALADFSDPAKVQAALEQYFSSGKINQELAQEVFRICEEVTPAPALTEEEQLQKEAEAAAQQAANAARKHLKMTEKDQLEDASMVAAQAKVTGKEEVKQAPMVNEPKPEGSIDAATLAHQLSGRRRV